MNKILLDKYAYLLLKALRVEDKKYLFISIPNYLSEFKDSLLKEAKKYDLKDIYVEEKDVYKRHELLVTIDKENLIKHPMFDLSIYNKYAKLDAAFLFIRSEIPHLMEDVSPEILKDVNLHSRETQKYFRDLYESDKLNWLICAAANPKWAKDDLNISEDELWDLIFKICLVDSNSDPYLNWLDKNIVLRRYMDTLNSYRFKYLCYENKLGTKFKLELPMHHKWMSGASISGVFNNLPTEEVFTSPKFDSVEGVVYASKPLIYNDSLIDDFWIKFKDGKVIDFDAKVGYELLKSIIETDDHSCYLGECALVSHDSAISNTNVIFHETLYDENAACHLALGIGFAECLDLDHEISSDELLEYGVNKSKTHVDFMIGTDDMLIKGITYEGDEICIMKDGNLII